MAARPTLIVPCGAPATVATGSPAAADWRAGWLGWLDAALHREILRLRARYALSSDELRGLYVTDVQVDRLLSAAGDPRSGAEGGDGHDHDGHDHELAALEDYCRSQVATLHETSSPLAAVQREFRLTDAEVRALVLCLAPETDLRYQPVFAYLNDDALPAGCRPSTCACGSATAGTRCWTRSRRSSPRAWSTSFGRRARCGAPRGSPCATPSGRTSSG